MNKIKSIFSIKDLENISGIKAHTIRIWEKRYNLLEPIRSKTNIRNYDIINLQKLINVVTLMDYGYKISKISNFTEEEINVNIKKIKLSNNQNNQILNSFKLAMFNFDSNLFSTTFKKIEENNDFETIFLEYIIPFLEEIGFLWSTNTITPAHEHFISYLIKQKLQVHIEKEMYVNNKNRNNTFILFLPYQEIHEIGLLFTHYLLLKNGFNSIYLGSSVPMDNLKDITEHLIKSTFLSYFTVYPEDDEIEKYIEDFNQNILEKSDSKLILFGSKTKKLINKKIPNRVNHYSNMGYFISELNIKNI